MLIDPAPGSRASQLRCRGSPPRSISKRPCASISKDVSLIAPTTWLSIDPQAAPDSTVIDT